MPSKYQDLVAYQPAVALADELHAKVPEWPSLQQWSIGVQLLRAANSVGANIAEAFGRWHRVDQRRFLYFARGSIYETEHWIRRAETQELLPDGTRKRRQRSPAS